MLPICHSALKLPLWRANASRALTDCNKLIIFHPIPPVLPISNVPGKGF